MVKYYFVPIVAANTATSMFRGPLKNITYEFVIASPVVFLMSTLSYLNRLWDGRLVTLQQLFSGVLPPEFARDSA